MENREDLKESKKDEAKTEKVVYKVIHVPYYYPVPVDAEWYYKHYDKFSKQHEKFSPHSEHPPGFEHFMPPPGFPFPRKKEYYEYKEPREGRDHGDYRYAYEDERDYLDARKRSISPTRSLSPTRPHSISPTRPHSVSPTQIHSISPTRSHSVSPTQAQLSPKQLNETSTKNVHRSESPTNNTAVENDTPQKNEDINKTSDVDAVGKSCDNKEQPIGTKVVKWERPDSPSEEEQSNDTNSERSMETTRKRKRYLMTFPYDQRKKKFSENDEDNKKEYRFKEEIDMFEKRESESRGHNDDDRERKYRKRVMVPADHEKMMSSHVPYVMVPMRSSQYSDMPYQPRYLSSRSHHSYEARHYSKSDMKDEREMYTQDRRENQENEKDDDEKKEIRFHANGRRARTVFSRQQLLTLNNVFEKHPFVSGERMSELSDQLGLDRKIVKIWFQNKRQYARKKGSLLEREEDYYYDYPGAERYLPTAPPPTMAERWKH